MSAKSESGGGFWRGFFTGVFLLFVGTIALIVIFPMQQPPDAPAIAPAPAPVSSGTVINPDGVSGDGAPAGESPVDTASLGPVIEAPERGALLRPDTDVARSGKPPETMHAPETALVTAVSESDRPVRVGGLEDPPRVGAAGEDVLAEVARGGSSPTVGPTAKPKPANIALVGEIGSPPSDGAAHAPAIAASSEAAPVGPPVPARTGENAVAAFEAGNVPTAGSTTRPKPASVALVGEIGSPPGDGAAHAPAIVASSEAAPVGPPVPARTGENVEAAIGAGSSPTASPTVRPKPASVALVSEIGSPSGDGAARAPDIVASGEAAPVGPPLPARTGENVEAVARAPRVLSGGTEISGSPTQEVEMAALPTVNSDAEPGRLVPSSRLTEQSAFSVAGAPKVAPRGAERLLQPATGNGISTRLPRIVEDRPANNGPAARIAQKNGPSVSPGVRIPVERTIGSPVRTFVSAPDKAAANSTAEAPAVAGTNADPEVRIAMAPVAKAPASRNDSPQIDTSAASKPRKRPEAPSLNGPAFEVFAAAFHDPGRKPLLSVILLDVGRDGIDRDELVQIQMPVTYAVEADDPDAPWADASFRENGFEVLAMVPRKSTALAISRGEQPSRAAAKLAAYFGAVPGAIGVVDRIDGSIQRDNNLVKALISDLGPTGHALLLNKGNGFGSGVNLARLENIPSTSVLRVIDKNRSPLAIRASLDRAALDASRAGTAVVIGRTYPETITTLVRWLLGSTARGVTLAPVSAAIRRQQ